MNKIYVTISAVIGCVLFGLAVWLGLANSTHHGQSVADELAVESTQITSEPAVSKFVANEEQVISKPVEASGSLADEPSPQPASSTPIMVDVDEDMSEAEIEGSDIVYLHSPIDASSLPYRHALFTDAEVLDVVESWNDEAKRIERVSLVLMDDLYPYVRVEQHLSIDETTGKEEILWQAEAAADHILVMLKEGVQQSELEQICQDADARIREKLHYPNLYMVEFDNPQIDSLPEYIERFAREDIVEIAEGDYMAHPCATTPNDPAFSLQNGFDNIWYDEEEHEYNMRNGYDINAPEAWDIRTDASNVIIAVIDTGVDYDHEDFEDNMWHNEGEIPWNDIDDDGNGFVDDYYGYNFWGPGYPNPIDLDGHGTAVASVAGAVGNNSIGIAGVCWDVQLLPLQISFDGNVHPTSWESDIAEAIQYANLQGAGIINMSFVNSVNSAVIYNAIEQSRLNDILCIAAAGNENEDHDNGYPKYPSDYSSDNIISVGASAWYSEEKSSFSDYGKQSVDLMAPGESLLTAMQDDEYYYHRSGTSFSTPLVSGACALLKAQFPSLNYGQIKELILNNVSRKEVLKDYCVAGGILNIERAIKAMSAPDSLTVSLLGDRLVRLSWQYTSTDSITGFRLQRRAVGSSDWEYVADVVETVREYDDDSMKCGNTYEYRVISLNGESLSCGVVGDATAQVSACVPPTPPSGVTVQLEGRLPVAVTWVDNAADETGYRLERWDNIGNEWVILAELNADTTSYLDDSTICSHTYQYRVASVNGDGPSAFAYSAGIITTTCVPEPAAPTDLTAELDQLINVALTWTDNSTSEEGFIIYRKKASYYDWEQIAIVPADTESWIDTESFYDWPDDFDNRYYYAVTAYNLDWESDCGDGVSVYFDDDDIYDTYDDYDTGANVLVSPDSIEKSSGLHMAHRYDHRDWFKMDVVEGSTYCIRLATTGPVNFEHREGAGYSGSVIYDEDIDMGYYIFTADSTRTDYFKIEHDNDYYIITYMLYYQTIDQEPAVDVSVPADTDQIIQYQSMPVETTVTMPSGIAVGEVKILHDSEIIATFSEAPYSGSVIPTEAGDYELIAQVYDAYGILMATDTITVNVIADTDGDTMIDEWEILHSLNPDDATDVTGDPDGDHLSNLEEYELGTNPQEADSDGDGLDDDVELKEPGALAVGAYSAAAIGLDQTVYWWGWYNYPNSPYNITLENMGDFGGCKQIAASYGSFWALTHDDRIVSWGLNNVGQLGRSSTDVKGYVSDPDNPAQPLGNVKEVVSAMFRCMALTHDGVVYALGNDSADDNIPVKISIPGDKQVVDVAIGYDHYLALTSDGEVYTWGANGSGQLGDGTLVANWTGPSTPVLTGVKSVHAGDNHSLAVMNDGTLKAWGANASGQLGVNLVGNQTIPKTVVMNTQNDSLIGVVMADGGACASVALLSDGTVWSWGTDTAGVLGNGSAGHSAFPTQVLKGMQVVDGDYLTGVFSIAMCNGTVFALTADKAFMWGNGYLSGDTAGNQTVPYWMSGLPIEYGHQTDPTNPDSDYDGLPDGWEVQYGLDPNSPEDADIHSDNDGLVNSIEYLLGTNPNVEDSDGDGTSDGDEDHDEDGLSNILELARGADPLAVDYWYTMSVYGVLGDETQQSTLNGVNNAGAVVGYYRTDNGRVSFVDDPSSSIQYIDVGTSVDETWALSITENGIVAGAGEKYHSFYYSIPEYTVPFIYENGGFEFPAGFDAGADVAGFGKGSGEYILGVSLMYDDRFEETDSRHWSRVDCRAYIYHDHSLVEIPKGSYRNCFAANVNKNGFLAGTMSNVDILEDPDDYQAFVYENGSVAMIPLPSGYSYSIALLLNDLGEVLIKCKTDNDEWGFFVYSHSAGTLTPVSSSTGTLNPEAMNNNGVMVGSMYIENIPGPGGYSHAFITDNGVPVDIHPVGLRSYAKSINNKNEVVGYIEYAYSEYPLSYQGFLVLNDGTMLNLEECLVDPMPAGYIMRYVDYINDAGHILLSLNQNVERPMGSQPDWDALMSPVDSDNDGVGNAHELIYYSTDPYDEDSDDDGLSDWEEIYTYGTDPNNENTDGDGFGGETGFGGLNPLTDWYEVMIYGTDPTDSDTDDDGLSDGGGNLFVRNRSHSG